MDGGNPRELVNTKLIWPNGLTIDYTTDRIFWGDAGTDRIEFVESDGSNRYNCSKNFKGVLWICVSRKSWFRVLLV